MMRTVLLSLLAAGCTVSETNSPDAPELDAPPAQAEGWATVHAPTGSDTLHWVEVDGYAIAEGDIILGRVEEMGRRGAPEVVGDTWIGGVVPYAVRPGMPDTARIADAIAHVQAVTDLTFVPRSGEADYVYFTDASGACSSYVGRRGGRQDLNLGAGCNTGSAIHELGHAVGLWHEHTRPDRDDYIDVVWGCIESGKEHNFHKKTTAQPHGPYDSTSIMHYGSWAFVDSSQRVGGAWCDASLLGKDGSWLDNQHAALSAGDVDAIDDLYGSGASLLQLELVGPPTVGATTGIRVFGAQAGERVYIAWGDAGIGPGDCIAALGGHCLDVAGPATLLDSAVADGLGVAHLDYIAPVDSAVFTAQAVAPRGAGGASSVWSDAVQYVARCPVGETRDCAGDCAPVRWLDDGLCDDGRTHWWGPTNDFDCVEYRWDGGDC